MSELNKKNKTTEKIIHLMITTLCGRDCTYCCNKQYDLNDVPYVTDEELRNAEMICLTGGEPFAFSNPCSIAEYYKKKYPNIKNIYVYTNAIELAAYIITGGEIHHINGLNVSIKCKRDALLFNHIIKDNPTIKNLESNLLYVFDNLYNEKVEGFKTINREWQISFEPSPDSIFRKI